MNLFVYLFLYFMTDSWTLSPLTVLLGTVLDPQEPGLLSSLLSCLLPDSQQMFVASNFNPGWAIFTRPHARRKEK